MEKIFIAAGNHETLYCCNKRICHLLLYQFLSKIY